MSELLFFHTTYSYSSFSSLNLISFQWTTTLYLLPTTAITVEPQIKSACYWSTAIYKGIWSTSKSQWVIDETANQQYIQELKQDHTSAPQEPVDCSQWD